MPANWAAKIKAHSASKQPRPRKPRPVVQSTWAQTRPPNEETGDPGAVIDVHYTVEDNTVFLTDKSGLPINKREKSYVLQPGEHAVRIASRMALIGRDRSIDATPDVSWVV